MERAGIRPREAYRVKQLSIGMKDPVRTMTGERRLQLAEQLYWTARKLKLAALRAQHPDWTEEQLTAEVRRIFLHART
jgi:hypothetical protein